MNASAITTTMESHQHQPTQSRAVKVRPFVWHLVQMVLVMNAGMMVYHLIERALFARIGIGAALQPYPAIRHIFMDISMVVPMVALMRYQRMSWRRNTEMVAAMMAGPVVFMAYLQFGLPAYHPWVSAKTLHIVAEVSMYVGMLAVMLYRRDEHAHGAHTDSGHQHAGSSQAEPTEHAAHMGR